MHGRKTKRKSGNRRFSLFYGRLTVHPLFLLFGAWHAVTGELFSFLTVTACALLHELAHAAAAAKIGFAATEIVLMPYGATLTADLDGACAKDEIFIALAGPFCNLATAVLFLALWWCFPALYPYTETAFTASLSLALCNLLPALPLDGGRVVHRALISLFNAHLPPTNSKKLSLNICRAITLSLCGLGVLAFTVLALRGQWSFSLVTFSLFLAVGAFPHKKPAFIKLQFSQSEALKRGLPLRQIAVSSSCTVKQALAFLSSDAYLLLHVYDEAEHFLGTLTQNELSEFFQRTHLYATLGESLEKIPENSLERISKTP